MSHYVIVQQDEFNSISQKRDNHENYRYYEEDHVQRISPSLRSLLRQDFHPNTLKGQRDINLLLPKVLFS